MRELEIRTYALYFSFSYVFLFFAQNRNTGCSFWLPAVSCAVSRAYFQFQIFSLVLLFKKSRILAFMQGKSRIPENLLITLGVVQIKIGFYRIFIPKLPFARLVSLWHKSLLVPRGCISGRAVIVLLSTREISSRNPFASIRRGRYSGFSVA